ncbi:MAG: CPBP family intramembrane glutamic endopeptidase [Ktedonobacterales bacterium]
MAQTTLTTGRKTDGEDSAVGCGIVVWVILLFGLTGIGVLSFILAGVDPGAPPPLFFIAIVLIGCAPSLAALGNAGFVTGAGGVRALVRQIGTWRVGIGWYVVALVGPLVLVLLANGIYLALGGAPPQQWVIVPSTSALAAFIGPLLAGSLGEEIGWCGFAQPRLQKRHGALWASVIVGILWSTWHFWPVVAPGGIAHLTPSDVVQTYVRLIATAILYAWLYNSTHGSLFLVMVAQTRSPSSSPCCTSWWPSWWSGWREHALSRVHEPQVHDHRDRPDQPVTARQERMTAYLPSCCRARFASYHAEGANAFYCYRQGELKERSCKHSQYISAVLTTTAIVTSGRPMNSGSAVSRL